ncbi:efflux transporter, RND family, MFP subunit [Candidatus Moduliflexus flocculans]|uniref:Efflux transporter, RND family, MFP subunit n=1 Tax=Candidatus Moduliflexus flocculans TaxID=1499966 RepID=A0A0S6W5A0_9BACT|nr:efflux transporter, RND family, MFP subunit [Candidatus Moduliflexus flocculans]
MSVRPFLTRKAAISALLMFGLVSGMIGCKKKEEQPVQAPKDDVKQVKLLTIEPSFSSGKREFPGKTEATQIAELAFRISGTLIEFPVKEGQRVQEGELIAKIDPRDYKTVVKQVSSSLENARAQLKAMQAGARKEEIAQLQADVSAKEASVEEVKTRLDRFSKLYKEKVVAKQQVDTIQAEYDMKVQALESAKQAMSEGKAGAR